MKINIRLIFSLICLLQALPLWANDGRDRTVISAPNRFELFPPPLAEDSGYRMLEEDGPGGADGTDRFRWVRPQAVSLVRIAAFETFKQFGRIEAPMAIFDLTSENGDTPVAFHGASPRGRHPGGSHDGGLNLDLGYYLKSTRGKVFQPDLAACSEHFSPKGEDLMRCQGPADRLAVGHQAFFLLSLAKLNRELFDHDLIEEIGIDLQVRTAVVQELENWVRSKKFGATKELVNDLKLAFTSDEWDGWASSHHHHIHLRLRDVSMFGRYRDAFENLRLREKLNDEVILRKYKKPLLSVRLYSQGLSRSIEAEILGGESGEARFRLGKDEWVKADASRLPKVSASWDVSPKKEASAVVEAELLNSPGATYMQTISMPEQPYYLFIAVDPKMIIGELAKDGDKWISKLTMPEAYRLYVTEVKVTPSKIASDTDVAFAEVTLSSRMKVKVPMLKPR